MSRLTRRAGLLVSGLGLVLSASSCAEPAAPPQPPVAAVAGNTTEKKLQKHIDCDMADMPAENVVQFVLDVTGAPCQVEFNAVASDDLARSVTLTMKDAPARAVLTEALSQAHLVGRIENDRLLISTRSDLPKDLADPLNEASRNALETRVSFSWVPENNLGKVLKYLHVLTGVRMELSDEADDNLLGYEPVDFSANSTPVSEALAGVLKHLDADCRLEAGVLVVFENHPHKHDVKGPDVSLSAPAKPGIQEVEDDDDDDMPKGIPEATTPEATTPEAAPEAPAAE